MAKADCFEAEFTNFIWKIKHPYTLIDCNVNSPSFSIDSCGITRYYLNFVSKYIDENTSNLSLYLKKHEWDCDPSIVLLNFHVSIIGNGIDKNYSLEHVNFIENSEAIFEEDICIMNGMEFSIDNVSTEITFNLEIEPDMNVQEIEDLWTCKYEDLESLSSDINRILHCKEFADLTFRSIDDKPARLHKTIFASRYPALAQFLDLLQNPKQEYNLGIDLEGISVLLRYLYSGKINRSDSKFGLIEILNKAHLHHLQHILFSEPRIVHASTSTLIKYGSFIWVIPKFSELRNNKYIINCLCCDNCLVWTQLRILLYIRENAQNERCVAFKVQRMDQNSKLLTLCKISIVGEEEEYNKVFQLNFQSERELIIPSFIELNEIQEKENMFLANDTLKFHFQAIVSNLEVSTQCDSVRCLHVERGYRPPISINYWSLRKDMAHLYLNSEFSDITIRSGELLIPAHKVILSARSPVFSAILQNEIEDNTIFLNKYDEETVVNILSYIYCGIVDSESKSLESVIKLYKAASEYQVSQLKQKCINLMEKTFNPSNITGMLELADECNDNSLQECAQKFIIANFSNVLRTEEFAELMNTKPYLTTSIVLASLKN